MEVDILMKHSWINAVAYNLVLCAALYVILQYTASEPDLTEKKATIVFGGIAMVLSFAWRMARGAIGGK